MWPFNRSSQASEAASRVNNRWQGDAVELAFPPLGPGDVGAQGARFVEAEFRRGSAAELFLCFLEEGQWARQYGAVCELTLLASTLVVSTSLGPVCLILWKLSNEGETLAWYEHYIDGKQASTRRVLERIGAQPRLKVVMRDNETGATTGFWELENNFALGDFADTLAELEFDERGGSFDERIRLVQQEYQTADLVALIEGH